MDEGFLLRGLAMYAPFALMWLGSTWLHYLLSLLASLAIFSVLISTRWAPPCQGGPCAEMWTDGALMLFAIVLFVVAVVGKALSLLRS